MLVSSFLKKFGTPRLDFWGWSRAPRFLAVQSADVARKQNLLNSLASLVEVDRAWENTRAAEIEAGVGQASRVAKKATACQAYWLRRNGGIVERQLRYGCRSMCIRCSHLQECILRLSLILGAPPAAAYMICRSLKKSMCHLGRGAP